MKILRVILIQPILILTLITSPPTLTSTRNTSVTPRKIETKLTPQKRVGPTEFITHLTNRNYYKDHKLSEQTTRNLLGLASIFSITGLLLLKPGLVQEVVTSIKRETFEIVR